MNALVKAVFDTQEPLPESQEEETQTETQETQETQTNPDIEAQAREMGWMPKEKYKGANPWVDAEKFIERGQKNIPILIGRIKQMEARLEEQAKVAQEYQEFANKAAEAKYKAEYDRLTAERRQAITEGDGEKFEEVDAKIQQHVAQKPQPKAAPVQTPEQRTLLSWQAENPWIESNPKVAAYAIAHGQELKAQGLSLPEILKGMREAAEEQFPDAFGGRQSTPQRGGRTGSATMNRGKSYDNLPLEAKEACEKFIRNGMLKDVKDKSGKVTKSARQQYLDNYQWES